MSTSKKTRPEPILVAPPCSNSRQRTLKKTQRKWKTIYLVFNAISFLGGAHEKEHGSPFVGQVWFQNRVFSSDGHRSSSGFTLTANTVRRRKTIRDKNITAKTHIRSQTWAKTKWGFPFICRHSLTQITWSNSPIRSDDSICARDLIRQPLIIEGNAGKKDFVILFFKYLSLDNMLSVVTSSVVNVQITSSISPIAPEKRFQKDLTIASLKASLYFLTLSVDSVTKL